MYGVEVENHQLLQGEAIVGLPMMMNNNNVYHVPQQSRREKLRYPNCQESLSSSPSTAVTASTLHHCQHRLKTNFSNPHFMLPSSSMPPKGHNNQHYISGPEPTEPFTGYAAVLQASRFLVPTKRMLEEICDVGVGRDGLDGVKWEPPVDDWLVVVDQLKVAGMNWGNTDGQVVEQRMKTWLISMLTEVYKTHYQYFDQIRAVIASFESIPGLLNATPYASMAMKSLSSLFSSIKDAIFNQLYLTIKPPSKEGQGKGEKVRLGVVEGGVFCRQQSTHAVGNGQHRHVWRPQRGLPEHAVAVLKAWLFEHFLHPYPTDTDKHMLAQETGLSRNQVSNWFINARVRLWKPMVEEVHYLEQRQNRKSRNPDPLPLPSRVNTSNPVTNKQMQLLTGEKAQESRIIKPVDSSYPHQPTFVGGGIGGISLTLGLQQNNEAWASIPLNVARQFGFEEGGSVSCVTSRSVGDRDLCVGMDMNKQQFVRDYVG